MIIIFIFLHNVVLLSLTHWLILTFPFGCSCLIAFVLLPYLVVSRPGQQHINKVFARRTRASPRYVGSAPRQVRFSRYIQEPELQEVQQQQQNLDDVDLEGELEPQQQLTETGYGAEKGTTKSNGFLTQAPLYETSTARPVQKQQVQQQMKGKASTHADTLPVTSNGPFVLFFLL